MCIEQAVWCCTIQQPGLQRFVCLRSSAWCGQLHVWGVCESAGDRLWSALCCVQKHKTNSGCQSVVHTLVARVGFIGFASRHSCSSTCFWPVYIVYLHWRVERGEKCWCGPYSVRPLMHSCRPGSIGHPNDLSVGMLQTECLSGIHCKVLQG